MPRQEQIVENAEERILDFLDGHLAMQKVTNMANIFVLFFFFQSSAYYLDHARIGTGTVVICY